MNNFSPLPASISDTRLSRPEAAAPAASPELQERRQKLRRVVTWVVGGAAALMCVGLVCGAVRSHYRSAALVEASAEAAQALAAAPVSAPSVAVAAIAPTDTSAVTSASPRSADGPVAAKPAKKAGGTHAKSKHAASKSALAHR